MKVNETNALLIRQACPEDFPSIREFLLESCHLYPSIDQWWLSRVLPALQKKERIALVVDSGESLEGICIAKPGHSAKLCSLRLRENIRNQGIGRVLITEALKQLLASNPAQFHVTISEAAEAGCIPFFEGIGFRRVAIRPDRYKFGVDEFVYSGSKEEIKEAVSNQLAEGLERTLFGTMPIRMPAENTLLMSLRPQFAEMVMQGRKTVEFRRRFSKKYEGARIVFYITNPVKQFMFTAKVSKVEHRQKDRLWGDFQEQGGISRNIFDDYFEGTNYGYAIHLSEVQRVPNQLDLKHAQALHPELRPPQSFQRLEPKSPLIRALQLPIHV